MSIISGMNDNNLRAVVPPEGTPVISINGVLFPVGVPEKIGVDTSDGNANPEDVVAGQIFYNKNGKQTGTMEESHFLSNGVSFYQDTQQFDFTVMVSSGYIKEGVNNIYTYPKVSVSEIMPVDSGNRTIQPSTTNKTISGGRFLANNITIKGDSNLVAENIKKGVVIFGVEGSHEGSTEAQSGENSYYMCTSIVSNDTWQGYEVVVEDDVLTTKGEVQTFSIEKNTPEMGGIYDSKAMWSVNLNEPVINAPLRKDIGGQATHKLGLQLRAKAENKSEDEMSYSLVEAPSWMGLEDNVLTGTPTSSGTYSAKVKVETDDYMPVLVNVGVNVIEKKSDAMFYLPLHDNQQRADSGQYLTYGRGIYNPSKYYKYFQPEYVTHDGYKCAKFVSGYEWNEDIGEETYFITSLETNELANITDTAKRTVSFLACPQRFNGESEWGDDTNYGAAVLEWGQTAQHKMFKVGVSYDYLWDEDNGDYLQRLHFNLSLWNGDLQVNTGLGFDNKMHHFAFSMDCTGDNAGTMKVYLDGNKIWEGWLGWGTPHTVNSPISIGKVYGDNAYNFEGYVAEIKVWDKILTDQEVMSETNRAKQSAKA